MPGEPAGERLQKVLAHAGVGSRRAVEALIEAGRVAVDGHVAHLGQRVEPSKAKVEVDGERVPLDPAALYYLVNKPAGVVATASDERGRPTVLDLLDPPGRVWPVGRLDIDTEGAIVVTNDGDLTLRLSHPRFGVEKTYLAEVEGHVSGRALARLRRGIELEDGPARAARAALVERHGGGSLIEIAVAEGRNREVRRMLDAIGHPVRKLVRVAIGPLRLGHLRPGTGRRLSPHEVRGLYGAGPSEVRSPRGRRRATDR